MKTTATNRKVSQLLTSVEDDQLVINPAFQRRLVWKNKDKSAFLRTVLDEYPFPEIYIATGKVDLDTGRGIEMLVDGQQRVSTLFQYFKGSEELRLGEEVPPYSDLSTEGKTRFLQYDVVVRDLGPLSEGETRAVFQRINSTGYSLNAMEIHNSRFDGEFKVTAEELADEDFFGRHRIFSANQARRMEDTRFVLYYMTTIMSTYFNRDAAIEVFLEKYNEEFEDAEKIKAATKRVFSFIEECGFEASSRAWKLGDLFTLMVETHRAIERLNLCLDYSAAKKNFSEFYERVAASDADSDSDKEAAVYQRAALQATNDRANRIRRGEIVAGILKRSVVST